MAGLATGAKIRTWANRLNKLRTDGTLIGWYHERFKSIDQEDGKLDCDDDDDDDEYE